MKKILLFLLGGLIIVLLVAAYFALRSPFGVTVSAGRHQKVVDWIRHPFSHVEWVIQAGERCENAPFLFPTTGYVGYLWGDSFRPGHKHQGLDIFSGTDVGQAAVIAAYDGFLTRLPDWKSTVIIRIPADPFAANKQIWTYYTHMADKEGNSFISEQFPPGSYEIFVPAGTLLGYQGNYSGTPGNPTGVHLHFSIVKDDGLGGFLNELKIENTLDPSPYFGMSLNAYENKGLVPGCEIIPEGGD